MAELHPREERTSSTVCLFFSHRDAQDDDDRPDGYSLYGIDVSMANEQVLEVASPRLLLRLPLLNRSEMVCAKLGSKFYFLGGLCLVGKRGCFPVFDTPSDVFVYDPTNKSMNAKDPAYRVIDGESMNCGKVNPTTFEVNGKLYVLGCLCANVDDVSLLGCHYSNVDESSLFEEYDPVKNRWTKLEVPPVRGQTYGWCSSSVVSPTRVLISAIFGTVLTTQVVFSFNPQTYEWSRSIRSVSELDFHPLFVEDGFYGIEGGCRVSKLGPFSSREDDQLFHMPFRVPAVPKASIDWGDTSPITERLAPPLTEYSSYPLICHLSDRCFCIIEGASCVKPSSNPYQPDPYHRLLKVIIYKELQGDQTLLKLKCLHQSLISMHTDFSTFGELTSCHVMSTEEGKNNGIPVGDKNVETNSEDQKNKRIWVDEQKIGTDQSWAKKGFGRKEFMDVLKFWQKMSARMLKSCKE